MKILPQYGYEQYEISNFAQPGKRSKHNSSYWHGKPYYGFGPSAHSYNGKQIRKWNISNNALYIEGISKGLSVAEEENLTPAQQLNEYIMISLRTKEGIDMNRIAEEYGDGEQNRLIKASEKFISDNKMIASENKLRLTDEGKTFADGIASELFA